MWIKLVRMDTLSSLCLLLTELWSSVWLEPGATLCPVDLPVPACSPFRQWSAELSADEHILETGTKWAAGRFDERRGSRGEGGIIGSDFWGEPLRNKPLDRPRQNTDVKEKLLLSSMSFFLKTDFSLPDLILAHNYFKPFDCKSLICFVLLFLRKGFSM